MAILHYQNGILVPFASPLEGKTILRENQNPSLEDFIIERAKSPLDSEIWNSDLVSSSYIVYRSDADPSFIRGLKLGNPVIDEESDENEINLGPEVSYRFLALYPRTLQPHGPVVPSRSFGEMMHSLFDIDREAGNEYGRKLQSQGIGTTKVFMARIRSTGDYALLRQIRLKGLREQSQNKGGVLCDGRPYFKKLAS